MLWELVDRFLDGDRKPLVAVVFFLAALVALLVLYV